MTTDPNPRDPHDPKKKPAAPAPNSLPTDDLEAAVEPELEALPIVDAEADDLPLAPNAEIVPPFHDTFAFDEPELAEELESRTMGIRLEDLNDPELLAHLRESTGLSDVIPAEPASDAPLADPASSGKISLAEPAPGSGVSIISEATPGSSVIIGGPLASPGNFEPIVPVEIGSGWLDGSDDVPAAAAATEPVEEPLGVHSADLFDTPPTIESSDIFSSGPVPTALGTEHSDVIAATAYGPVTPNPAAPPARPSDVALTFDQPPGGSTIDDSSAGLDLPVAEEVAEAADEFESELEESPVLPHPQSMHDAVSDYGSTPIATPDASSILSDLSDPGEITIEESSAVRLEAPGVGRTHTSEEGTEFDLTISDDPIHPDLAAAEDVDDEATDWRQQSGSDLFSEGRTSSTSAEIDLDEEERVVPINPTLRSDDPSLTSAPSSIFTGGKVPGSSGSKSGTNGPSSDSVRIGRPADEEDASVEFSDNPLAEPESSSAALLMPKDRKRPPGKVEFNEPKQARIPPAMPAHEDDFGKIDFSAALADSDEATIGFPQDMIGASPSEILKHLEKKAKPEDDRTRLERPSKKKGKGKPVETDESDPSVEIDWVAGSSSEEPAIGTGVSEAVAPKKDKTKGKDKGKDKKKDAAKPKRETVKEGRSGKGGWIGGTVLGMVLAGGACAGLYYGGVIPSAPGGATAQNKTNPKGQPDASAAPAVTVADAHAALNAGDPAKALKVLDAVKSTAADTVSVETKAAIGQARLFSAVQELGKTGSSVADNAELKKAREELQAVVDDREAVKTPEGEKAAVKAAIHLGLTYELAGDWKKAKKTYDDSITRFPDKYKPTFQAALDRLAATAPAGAIISQRRLTPADAEKFLLALILLQADAPAKDDDEAGGYFWKAVKLASTGKYGDAVEEIGKAKAAHIKRAKSLAGRGLNPLTDPLEQIFPHACDDLVAYWNLRAAIYDNASVADLIQKEGAKEAMKTLAAAQAKALEAVKLMADLKESGDKLAAAQKKGKDTVDRLVEAQKELKDAVEKFEAKAKTFMDNEVKGREENVLLMDQLKKSQSDQKKADVLVASLAKELQSAKLLPEKYDSDALLAAQKSAIERASGPTLTGLVPPGMMGVVGAPITAGQLIDVASRLVKSETAARAATDKLAAETRRLTTEHAAELKKLKEGNETAVKKLQDDHAAEMKKLTESYVASTTKLKDDQAAELKKMAEKSAGDLKKLTEENAVAVKKLTDGYEGKIKNLETAVAKEKAAGESVAASLRVDLKNSVTPAQALDLWLPQLTELRRVSDADPALANANKVMASAPADSEDLAKAHTVAGLAYILKGDLAAAKEQFQQAQSGPAYKASAGKTEWAHVADVGLASVADPLAPYRLPVEKPRRDVRLAARYLDDGIRAYKQGRYADSAAALIESTKADPTDPIAWYYLGAAHWAVGAREDAKKDYQQGGEWEKLSPLTSRAISDALEPIQGPARDTLTTARP